MTTPKILLQILLYAANGGPLIVRDPLADIPPGFDPSAPQPGVTCSACGCSDEDSCPPGGCFWVAPGECSECRPDLAEAWIAATGLP